MNTAMLLMLILYGQIHTDFAAYFSSGRKYNLRFQGKIDIDSQQKSTNFGTI